MLLEVLTPPRMVVSPFSLLTVVSKTPQLQKEHLFVNQLKCEPLCFMIRSSVYVDTFSL